MKNLLYKIAILALFLPLGAEAHTGKLKGRYTKEKTIKKEFRVNPDALLKVKNRYGNLNLTSWEENRIVIEVHIKTNGDNEDKVARKLEEIDVEFDASASEVSALTMLGNKASGWNWSWGKSDKVSMQVNYTIKLPVRNSVNLQNDYGSISLDRIDGHAKINCDYGSLDIGELRGRNNQLAFDYTKNSRIDYIRSGSIRADYSSYTIEKAGSLEINADYTHSSIGEMDDLVYSADYGQLDVKSVKNVEGSGDYINVYFGEVYGDVDLSADYGAIKISDFKAKGGEIHVSSDYTAVKIGFDPGIAFDLDIETEYAGVNGIKKMELSVLEQKSSSSRYIGYYGKENSGNKIVIRSTYGGVTLYER